MLRDRERALAAGHPARRRQQPQRGHDRRSRRDHARADAHEPAARARPREPGRGLPAGRDQRDRSAPRQPSTACSTRRIRAAAATSTIGGNVAENAGGLRGLKYGVTRDYLLGCEAVLATGEVIRAGGKLVKEVAGYDLLRLLCGSEGTLAVMTELTLRLVPAPEASRARAGLLPLARGRRPRRLAGAARRRPAGDARVPRRDLHRDGGGLRRDRPAPRCRRGADLRPGRRSRGGRARRRPDRRGLRGRGRDRGQRRARRGGEASGSWTRAARRCRRCRGWAA